MAHEIWSNTFGKFQIYSWGKTLVYPWLEDFRQLSPKVKTVGTCQDGSAGNAVLESSHNHIRVTTKQQNHMISS